jgi:RNA-binding protein
MSKAPPPKSPRTLTGAQRRALRAQGHHLKPVVQVGHAGVSEGVVAATLDALETHELIKVSVSTEAPDDRKQTPQDLADATGSHVAQVIGRTALLYRRRLDDPQVTLPGVVDEAPRPVEDA